MIQTEEPVVRLQKTISTEARQIDSAENPVQTYERLTLENLLCKRVCHAPGNSGLVFYIDNESKLYTCNTASLIAPLAPLKQDKWNEM